MPDESAALLHRLPEAHGRSRTAYSIPRMSASERWKQAGLCHPSRLESIHWHPNTQKTRHVPIRQLFEQPIQHTCLAVGLGCRHRRFRFPMRSHGSVPVANPQSSTTCEHPWLIVPVHNRPRPLAWANRDSIGKFSCKAGVPPPSVPLCPPNWY